MTTTSKLAWLAAGASLATLMTATGAFAQALAPANPTALATPLIPQTVRAGATTPVATTGNYLRPRIGVQAAVTDNVNSSSTDKQSDTLGRVGVGADGRYDSPRLQATMTGDVYYDAYAKNSKYDTLSFNGAASATYIVMPQTLAIEAAGANTQGSASTFGATDFYRNANQADYQVGTYYIGPHLSLTPNFADISAAARFGQVFFDGQDNAPLESLADTTSFYQVIAAADTKDRLGRLRLVTSGQYQEDDQDFQSTGGSVSGFVQATPTFTGIMRVGYDDSKLTSAFKINGMFWALGGQFVFGERGSLRVEGGRRYDNPYWAGQALFQVNRQLSLMADYTSTLESGAIGVNNVLVEYVGDLSEPLPLPNIQQGFRLDTNYFDQASLNRTGNVRAQLALGRQVINLELSSTQQKYLALDGTYRTIAETIAYSNQVRPDLVLSLAFTHATERFGGTIVLGGDGDGTYYQTLAKADYGLNSRTRLSIAYQNRRSRPSGATGIDSYDENIGSIALVRQF